MKALLVILALGVASVDSITASCHHKHHKPNHHKECGIQCGPNRWQASPCLDSARREGCDVIVKGTLESVPHTQYLIQFFNNPLNGDKKAEGKTLIGQKFVETDDKGSACIDAVVTCTCACGDNHKRTDVRRCGKCLCSNRCTLITATATRLRDGKPGDTSEFSKSIKVS
jgi:hypothetical protein